MKKRIILLITILFVTCGCTAEANLYISDTKIDEEIVINYFADNNNSKENIKNMFRDYYPVYKDDIIVDTTPDAKEPGVEYYKKDLTDIGSGYSAKYSYSYYLNNYNKAKGANMAFRSISVNRDIEKGTITLSTDSGGFNIFNTYPELESFNLKIKTDNEVLESNVEPVNGVYTWRFTPDNNKKNVYMVIKSNNNASEPGIVVTKEDKEKEKTEMDRFLDKYAIFIAIGAIIGFVLLIKIVTGIQGSKYN